MKDETEVQEKRDQAQDATNRGSKYPGMTYEEGIRDALEWVLGDLPDDELLGE